MHGVIAEQALRIATVVRRLGSLREPRSVEYVRGSKMWTSAERQRVAVRPHLRPAW